MIRLHKDAPWEKVKIGEVYISKTEWIDEQSINYLPVQKWVVFKQEKIEPIVEKIEEEAAEIDLNSLTKSELIDKCKEKNLNVKGKSKTQLIELLTL